MKTVGLLVCGAFSDAIKKKHKPEPMPFTGIFSPNLLMNVIVG